MKAKRETRSKRVSGRVKPSLYDVVIRWGKRQRPTMTFSDCIEQGLMKLIEK